MGGLHPDEIKPVVFLSYARNKGIDEVIAQKLNVLLDPLARALDVRVFFDGDDLTPGDVITPHVQSALDATIVGVSLVSGDYLDGDRYCFRIEFPQLVDRAEAKSSRFLASLVSDCLWDLEPRLHDRLFANDVKTPLDTMTDGDRSKALAAVARLIANEVKARVPVSPVATISPPPPPTKGLGTRVALLAPIGDPARLGELVGVPELGTRYVERSAFSVIRDALLTTANLGLTSAGATLGMSGEGGVGKTVLAVALARDTKVRAAFPDGIVWLTVGQGTDTVESQRELCRQLGAAPDFNTPADGLARLKSALADRRTLVVLDDVWSGHQLTGLLATANTGRTLVTSRHGRTVLDPLGVRAHQVDVLSGNEALTFLAWAMGVAVDDLPSDADAMVAETGGVALALSLVGAAVRRGRPWTDVVHLLERNEFGDHPYANAFASLQVAVGSFDAKLLARWRLLAVYPQDERIPIRSVEQLWSKFDDTLVAADVLAQFADRSLLTLDSSDEVVSFHDLTQEFLRFDLDIPITLLHGELLDAYATLLSSPDRWADLPLDEPYIWEHLARHLAAAGRPVAPVVMDPAYLARRIFLSGSSFGAEADLAIGATDSSDAAQARVAGMLGKTIASVAHALVGIERVRDASATLALLSGLPIESCDMVGRWRPTRGGTTSTGAVRTMSGHLGRVTDVAFSTSGRLLATAAGDSTIRIWNCTNGSLLHSLELVDEIILRIALLPDESRLVFATTQQLGVWDQVSRRLQTRSHVSRFPGFAMTLDGKQLALVSNRTVHILDLESLEELSRLPTYVDTVCAISYAPDGKRLAFCRTDGTAEIWETAPLALLRQLAIHDYPLTEIVFLSDGRHVLGLSSKSCVMRIDLDSGDVTVRLPLPDGVRSLVCPPDGAIIAAAYRDRIIVCDAYNASTLDDLVAHTGQILAIAMTSNGRTIATASEDRTAKIWNLDTTALARRAEQARDTTDPCGEELPWGVTDGRWSDLLESDTAAESSEFSWLPSGDRFDPVKVVGCSTDRHLVATVGTCLTRTFLNDETGESMAGFELIHGVALSYLHPDVMLRIWDTTTHRQVTQLDCGGLINAVRFSRNQSHIASIGVDQTLRIWSLDETSPLLTIHLGIRPTALAVAPDDQRLYVACGGQPLLIDLGAPLSADESQLPEERTPAATTRT